MADKRINALTTTSASVGDDYFAIDGATNGTRALSAFSPTFGGNATVTGTLTVNSTLTANGPASGITVNGAGISLDTSGNSASLRFLDSGTPAFWLYKLPSDSNLWVRDMVNTRMQARFLPGATSSLATSSFYSKVEIDATTASTTTSSGALVVGNGTSGGLGVGGNVTVGGQVDINAGTASAPSLKLNGTNNGIYYTGSNIVRIAANATEAATFSATAATVAGTFTANTSVSSPQLVISDNSLGLSGGAGFYKKEADTVALGVMTSNTLRAWIRTTDARWFYQSGTPVTIQDTTASTATNIGALVVSGGVGVAGAIVTGGIVRCGGTNGLSLGSDTGNIRIDSAGPAGVEFRGLSAADTITGFTMREMALIDGTAAPSTRAGYATIYVDSADGDLKVKFGDGTVKTIATDS